MGSNKYLSEGTAVLKPHHIVSLSSNEKSPLLARVLTWKC